MCAKGKPRICILGAGFSGLTAGIQLKRKLNLESFTIYDENTDVGGTWLLNRYPGCACDVPSHFYSWSFELNPYWTKTNAPQEEILNYIKTTALKYDLYPHIQFQTLVKSFVRDASIQKWRVGIFSKDTKLEAEEIFDIVINGPGILRLPNYPEIFKTFRGPVIHSAQWDSALDLQNNVVGIVGSGASAVQIIPAIAAKVKELYCYQRKPAWVKRRAQYEFSARAKWILSKVPLVIRIYRSLIFLLTECWQSALLNTPLLSGFEKRRVMKEMKDAVPDPALLQNLTPNFPVGCKRITYSDTYYPAMSLPHVHVLRENIVEVTGNTIVTANGKSKELDVLILATGFQVNDLTQSMKIIGKDGVDILALWKVEGPKQYYGVTGTSLPNHFMIFGPNPGGSVLFLIEGQVDFVVKIIGELMRKGARSVAVSPKAQTDFVSRVERQMKRTSWDKDACGSWSLNARAIVTALWPWNSVKYCRETQRPNFSGFQFTY